MADHSDYTASINMVNAIRVNEPQHARTMTTDWHVGIPRTKGDRRTQYKHPEQLFPIMTRDQFITAPDENWKKIWLTLCQKNCPERSRNIPLALSQRLVPIWAHPSYIGPLYTNEYFPYHPNRRHGNVTAVDANNIYNGRVLVNTSARWDPDINHFSRIDHPNELTIEAEFEWFGYATRMYDGDMYMHPLSRQSFVEGLNANGYFLVECDKLVEGSFPGALNIFPLIENV